MKTRIVLLISMLLTLAAWAEDANTKTTDSAKTAIHKPDDVVARVGKTEIKWKDVDGAATSFVKEFSARGRVFPENQMDRLHYDVLNEMVTRELVLQQASGHEADDLDARVKDQIEQSKTQAGGEENLNKALAEMGVTLADYAKRVREGLMMQDFMKKIIDEKSHVTADDARKFYDANPGKFAMPEQVRASHILILVPPDATDEVKTQKLTQVKAALSLVKSGQPFADVARKFSEDPGSAKSGGDLDFFGRGQMVPEFEAAAFSLKTNEVSDVVTTHYGYHIIKVTDHRPASTMPYAEAEPKIERYLKQQQAQEIAKQYVEELRAKSKVEILLPEPPPLEQAPRSMAPGAPAGSMPTVETKPVAAPQP